MPRGRPIKNHFVAALGEFTGTFLFLFFAFGGTQTANLSSSTSTTDTGPDLQQLLYISLIFGFSLAINVWIFFRVSGGLFNPAVTLALCITGVVPPLRSLFVFISQLLGAIAAAAVIRGLIPGNQVLFNVKLATGTSIAQGLFLEMFLTTELVFAILMLAAEKTKATFVAPVGIGLALFVAELVGVYWTGGALNPARAFGPAVVLGQFNGYHWIYWLGPFLGALLASSFYALIKYLNYEEVNGDQDKSQDEEKILDMAKKKAVHDRKTAQSNTNTKPHLHHGHEHTQTHANMHDHPIVSGDGYAPTGRRLSAARSEEGRRASRSEYRPRSQHDGGAASRPASNHYSRGSTAPAAGEAPGHYDRYEGYGDGGVVKI